jgi:putative nucleotidyltransferase with HDIG domain
MNQRAAESDQAGAKNRLQGDLKIMSVSDLLRWIGMRGQSGTLTLVNDAVQKTLMLHEGLLAGLSSNRKDESYEHILTGAGFVGREQLDDARRQSWERRIPLVRYLVETKLLDQASFQKLQTFRLLRALADVLCWEGGFFTFEGATPEKTSSHLVRLPISEALNRACHLNNDVIEQQHKIHESLFQAISQRIMSGEFNLPPMPKTLGQIQHVINSPDGSAHDVLKIVMADQVLTSKILKVVNSSFYSLANPVTSVQHAIVMVGFNVLLGIVTTTSLAQVSGQNQEDIVQLMRHSFKCAYVAKKLARNLAADEEIAFVCGLLHDIGKIVLYDLLSEYEILDTARKNLIANYHIQAGILLAAKWNLPEVVIDAIDCHHDPDRLTACNQMAAIVYLADRMVNDGQLPQLDKSIIGVKMSNIDFQGIAEELQQVETFVDTIF